MGELVLSRPENLTVVEKERIWDIESTEKSLYEEPLFGCSLSTSLAIEMTLFIEPGCDFGNPRIRSIEIEGFG